jgi:hypothetical protein
MKLRPLPSSLINRRPLPAALRRLPSIPKSQPILPAWLVRSSRRFFLPLLLALGLAAWSAGQPGSAPATGLPFWFLTAATILLPW